jgi:hypothetical protein
MFTYESDVFDFAMMAWELLSRRLFMAAVTHAVAIQRVVAGCRPNTEADSRIPAPIMELLCKGWAVDPCERPPIRAFVALFTMFSPPLNPLLRCHVRDMLHLTYCDAPKQAFDEIYRACQQQRLQQLQHQQGHIHHPHVFDANFTRRLLRSPCIAHDGEVYDSHTLTAWIKWMSFIVGQHRFVSPATLTTYDISGAYVDLGSGCSHLSYHQPAHGVSAQLKDMEDALSGNLSLFPPDIDSKGPSVSSVTAPLKELRDMYEHASLPLSCDSLSTCQVRCKRWAKYIMEVSAKVTGLVMLRMQEDGRKRAVWLLDENLKEFPFVLNTSFAIERGVSVLHILRRYCEGNGWDAAAQLYGSCATELEYALWSLWPFLHNRLLAYVHSNLHYSISPVPPQPSSLVLVGPGEHCRFASLARAVEAASCGDTLLVLADVVEAGSVIAIDKDLHIVGCSPNGPVNIQARFHVTCEAQFSRVCLQGVSFVDSEPTLTCTGQSANVLLRRCHLTSAGRKEIMFLDNHATCVMKECLVYNAGDVALSVEGGSRLSMMACDVVNVGVGVVVACKSVCSMRLCCFKDCRENAVIVMDPVPREQSQPDSGTTLLVDRTVFINRWDLLFSLHLSLFALTHLCSGFIAPHKQARNPSDAFMNIAFSTLFIQVGVLLLLLLLLFVVFVFGSTRPLRNLRCCTNCWCAEVQPAQAADARQGRQGAVLLPPFIVHIARAFTAQAALARLPQPCRRTPSG